MNVSQDAPADLRARTKFGKRVFVWLGLTSVIFAGVTAVLFGSIMQLINSTGWVAHSYQVIDALDVTEDVFTDAQSAERGYVATCKQALISPFRSDLPRIYSEIANLRALTADNPAQQRRVEALKSGVNDELARMSAVVAENLRGDVRDAQASLTDSANTRATRSVFATIDAMEAEERGLLAGRLHTVQRNAWVAVVACSFGVAACIAILAFVFWLVRREVRLRAASESSLKDSNGHLRRSLGELRRYNDTARSIAILGELLQTCRNAGEALAITARHYEELFPGVSGAIALFNNQRDMLDIVQKIGAESGLADSFLPDECWGLRRGRVHGTQNGEPRCTHIGGGEVPTICLPLSAQSEALGVLTLRTVAANGYAEIDRQAIQTIAEQLSLSLANLRLQETLRSQSFRDPLTGLFNRRYMDDALAREISRAQRHGGPVSIAMVDIDHFKRFNDTHGHEGGDALLVAFAQLLGDHARSEDIVCRYGGEEFAIILPGAPLETAKERLDLVRSETRRLRVLLRGQSLGPVSVSAGVAMFPAHGATGMAVLHVADAALYQAKSEGRDRVIAAPTPDALLALAARAG